MKPGEPAITRRAVHNSGDGNRPIRRVVIHATCPGVGYPAASKKGTASGTAKYFQQQSSGGSAHYVYDSSRDEQHCVPEDTIAWHAPPNSHTVGIEICGEASYTRMQWLSAAVWPGVEEAAARTRELCARYDLPMRKLTVAQVKANAEGVCGHVDVSRAFRQTDHTDPGPNFPWPEFMHLVNADEPAVKPIKVVLDANGFAVWPGRVLELADPMLHGEDVKALQARWAKRGWDIDVDGWYGEQSRGVCRSWQRAVDLSDTGRVDKTTWDSVWSWTKPPTADAKN